MELITSSMTLAFPMRMVFMSTETKIITMTMIITIMTIITMIMIMSTGIIIIIIIPMMMNEWGVNPMCLPSAGSSSNHLAEVPRTVFAT